MKLKFTYSTVSEITKGTLLAEGNTTEIQSIAFDTRKILNGENVLFFALTGDFRNGHSFIQEAYNKGIRHFIISDNIDITQYPQSTFILVKDTLWALQEIANFHRKQFKYPIIAITGSAGKTMVKEWIYHFISSKYRVVRSPKSFN